MSSGSQPFLIRGILTKLYKYLAAPLDCQIGIQNQGIVLIGDNPGTRIKLPVVITTLEWVKAHWLENIKSDAIWLYCKSYACNSVEQLIFISDVEKYQTLHLVLDNVTGCVLNCLHSLGQTILEDLAIETAIDRETFYSSNISSCWLVYYLRILCCRVCAIKSQRITIFFSS